MDKYGYTIEHKYAEKINFNKIINIFAEVPKTEITIYSLLQHRYKLFPF